jgi:hypothetical protein
MDYFLDYFYPRTRPMNPDEAKMRVRELDAQDRKKYDERCSKMMERHFNCDLERELQWAHQDPNGDIVFEMPSKYLSCLRSITDLGYNYRESDCYREITLSIPKKPT